jgi:hypothetical protein
LFYGKKMKPAEETTPVNEPVSGLRHNLKHKLILLRRAKEGT